MKIIFTIASLFFLHTAAVAAQPVTDSVIINNFVFDSSGSPWLGDWVLDIAGTDTASFFLPSAPPGSTAKWSIWFSASADEVSRTFTHLSSGIYQLSCWAKSIQRGTGTALFVRNDTIIMTKVLGTIADSTTGTLDTNWIEYFLTDTVSLTSSDTFQIMLTGALYVSIYPATWQSLVNNIIFVKLLPSGGVSAAPNLSANLRAFPNPASGELQIMGAQTGEIHLFDLMGRERMSGTTDGSGTTLDVSTLPSGMYFVSDGFSKVKFVKE